MRWRTQLRYMGPAFVASVAYVDPGNVATNLAAGSGYGYRLVWVVVVASLLGGLVQYQSGRLGALTGRSLAQHVGGRLSKPWRLGYWFQAELVAAATDVAEVVGGAAALNLLFGLPLSLGGLFTGLAGLGILSFKSNQKGFERLVIGMLGAIAAGFAAGLIRTPPLPGQVAAGLVPSFDGPGSMWLALGILGATIMPHAVYAHSAFTRDRYGKTASGGMLRAHRFDTLIAMTLAGTINLSMLLLAAGRLPGMSGDVIQNAFVRLPHPLALMFASSLLISGLASTAVGSQAGSLVMEDLTDFAVPVVWRRAVTLLPAIALLALGLHPATILVASQVALAFGLPFAILPLLFLRYGERFTSRRSSGNLLAIEGGTLA